MVSILTLLVKIYTLLVVIFIKPKIKKNINKINALLLNLFVKDKKLLVNSFFPILNKEEYAEILWYYYF